MAEDVLEYDAYSVLNDFGMQQAVPMAIQEIRQLDSDKKKKKCGWLKCRRKPLVIALILDHIHWTLREKNTKTDKFLKWYIKC